MRLHAAAALAALLLFFSSPTRAERGPLTAEDVDVLHAAQRTRTPEERLETLHAEREIRLQELTAALQRSGGREATEILHRQIAVHKLETEVLFFGLQLEVADSRGDSADDPALEALRSRWERGKAALESLRIELPLPTDEEAER